MELKSTLKASIKKKYREVFSRNTSLPVKKAAGKSIVIDIIENIFFADEHIQELFSAINKKKKEKFDERPYKKGTIGRMNFLCEEGIVSKKLNPAMRYLFHEGIAKKGENYSDKFIVSARLFLNQIVEWTFDYFNESKDFIVPISVVNKRSVVLPEEIESVLNIRKEKKNLFKKNQTPIAFFVGFASFQTLFIPIIIAAVGFYKSNQYVFKKKVRVIRNLIFTAMILLSLGYTGYWYIQYLKELDERVNYVQPFYDPDPSNSGNGFFTGAYYDSIRFNKLHNELDANIIRELGDTFNLQLYYKPLTKTPIDKGYASMSKTRVIDKIYCNAQLKSTLATPIQDIVIINNVKPHEDIFPIEVALTNDFAHVPLECNCGDTISVRIGDGTNLFEKNMGIPIPELTPPIDPKCDCNHNKAIIKMVLKKNM